MNEPVPVPGNAGPDDFHARLTQARETLLQLHKVLMGSERVGYEQTFGKIQSPYHFLQLLTNDPWFAWLRPLSQVIAAMDEALDAKKSPLTSAMTNDFMRQAIALLVATEAGEGFSRHYYEALQRDPDVVFAHAEAMKVLRPNPAK
jgi:hypothetical protein